MTCASWSVPRPSTRSPAHLSIDLRLIRVAVDQLPPVERGLHGAIEPRVHQVRASFREAGVTVQAGEVVPSGRSPVRDVPRPSEGLLVFAVLAPVHVPRLLLSSDVAAGPIPETPVAS